MRREEIIFLNSVFFVLGFTLVFSLIGIIFQTALTRVSFSAMNVLREAGGSIIILFGLLIVLSARYIIPFFSTEHKVHVGRFSNSYVSSFVFGLAFAMGWTPCVGAILGSIYVLAATSPGIGFLLLLSFSLGLGIPFLIVGAFVSRASAFLKRIRVFLRYFNVASGIFLIAIGVLVVTDNLGILAVFLLGAQGSVSAGNQINFIIAIAAGALTFLSPCILPLLPAYFCYIAGTTADGARR
jgi:cytochrome c-type biogenesis protein